MRLMINAVIIFIVILYTTTPYPVIITFITSPASFFVWVLLNHAVLQCMKLNEREERGEERERKKNEFPTMITFLWSVKLPSVNTWERVTIMYIVLSTDHEQIRSFQPLYVKTNPLIPYGAGHYGRQYEPYYKWRQESVLFDVDCWYLDRSKMCLVASQFIF